MSVARERGCGRVHCHERVRVNDCHGDDGRGHGRDVLSRFQESLFRGTFVKFMINCLSVGAQCHISPAPSAIEIIISITATSI